MSNPTGVRHPHTHTAEPALATSVPYGHLRLLLGCELREPPEEAVIFGVEEDGSETCELSTTASFVLVRVPVRIVGEGRPGEATFHYSIGAFAGRETELALEMGGHTTLRFRIPLELFRARERFAVEVLAKRSAGPQMVLWTKCWEAAWQGKTPSLKLVPG